MDFSWLLHILVFVFGYMTCKTIYLFREVRLGLVMLKMSHTLGLHTIVLGLENYYFSRNIKINELRKSKASEQVIEAYKRNFDQEIERYKDKCIEEIIKIHPSFYHDVIKFNDWDSAMQFLNGEGTALVKKIYKEQ